MQHKKYNKLLSFFDELPLHELSRDTDSLRDGDDDENNNSQKEAIQEITVESLQRLLKELSKFHTDESLWDEVTKKDITPKKIVVFLQKVIHLGNGEVKFLGSQLYLSALTIPKSIEYSVFDALVYQGVFKTIKSWILTQDTKGVVHKKKKTNPKGKKKKKSEVEEEDEEAETEVVTEGVDLWTGLEYIKSILEALCTLLETLSLENEEEMRLLTIEVLSDLTRFTYGEDSKNQRVPNKHIETLHSEAYLVLQKLTSSIHGSPLRSHSIVLKSLLPNIHMSFISVKGSAPVPRSVKDIHSSAIKFVKSVIEEEDTVPIVLSFIQHLCVGVPERAEYRALCEDAVVEIICALPKKQRGPFIKFLDQLSKNKKSIFRVASVEIAKKLLLTMANEEENTENIMDNEDKTDDDETKKKNSKQPPCDKQACILLTILRDRSSDKLVAVRSRSLSYISELLETKEVNKTFDAEIEKVFFSNHKTENDTSLDTHPIDVVSLLKRRVNDGKCSVRKSALQLMSVICRRDSGSGPSPEIIQFLQERCYDPAISIRKQAIVTLCELLEHFPNCKTLVEVWASVVPRFVLDTEQTVQEKALEYFRELVLDRIRDYRKTEDTMIWLLVQRLEHGADIITAVDKGCAMIAKKHSISKALIDAIESAITSKHSDDVPHMRSGAWIIMSHLAPHALKHISYKMVVNYWEKIRDLTDDLHSVEHLKVISTLGHVATLIPDTQKVKLISDLIERLSAFSVETSWIQTYIQTLVKLGDGKKGIIDQWVRVLMTNCTEFLGEIVLPTALNNSSSQEITSSDKVPPTCAVFDRYLFTIGEVSRIRPQLVPQRLITIVQTLVAPTFSHLRLSVPDKDDPTILNITNITIPSSTRAHAFIALGKFCLENQTLAQKCISAFAREIETSKHPVVRNNVMVIMCDLCKRYTSLVDRYVSKLAICLRDESILVRRQTLMLLTHLIQEDYIKWNTAGSTLLFYRFVISLVDESVAIRQYANCCLISLFEKKSSAGVNIFFNNFVETMFYLNDYQFHSVYNQFKQTEHERALFTLKEGAENRKKRMDIYRIFLSHMQDTHKFNLQSKLVTEILGAVIENMIPVDKASYVILDTLVILASKEIKMKTSSEEKKDEGDVEEGENEAERLVSAATGRMLSKLQRKNIIENIIPIIIELKHLLSKIHSPLLRYVMVYLKELMADYKDEIGDILVTDPQLAKEIEYDMRQFKEQQRQVPVPPTPNFRIPLKTPRNKSSPPMLEGVVPVPRELAGLPVPSLRKSSVRRLSLPYQPSPARTKGHSPSSSETKSNETFAVPLTPYRTIRSSSTPSRIAPSPALQRMRNAEVTLPESPFPRKNEKRLRRRRSVTESTQSDISAESEETEIENPRKKMRLRKLDLAPDVDVSTEKEEDVPVRKRVRKLTSRKNVSPVENNENQGKLKEVVRKTKKKALVPLGQHEENPKRRKQHC